MKKLLNQMRLHARMESADRAQPKTGLVTGYDATNYSVKVTLQPEGIETGWIPLLSPWVGNGWGLFCPPTVDDMVEVQFEQGGAEAAFACLRFYNDEDRPLTVPSGEFWLVHKAGAFVKLTNDGRLLLNGQAEIDMTAPVLNITVSGNANVAVGGTLTSSAAHWNHSGPLAVDGPVTATGDVRSNGTVTGDSDVVGGGKSLKGHIHTGGTISGKTGTPV
jgi:phage baseplate assembly protein V